LVQEKGHVHMIVKLKVSSMIFLGENNERFKRRFKKNWWWSFIK